MNDEGREMFNARCSILNVQGKELLIFVGRGFTVGNNYKLQTIN